LIYRKGLQLSELCPEEKKRKGNKASGIRKEAMSNEYYNFERY
jgi:hypothetical protein